MASAAPLASYVDYSNLSKMTHCPVMSTPLTDAVSLLPCLHTVSEVVAKKLYEGNHSVEGRKLGNCPLCQQTVTMYSPNLSIRSLVEGVLKILPAEVLEAEAEKARRAERARVHREELMREVEKVPFPEFKRAQFKEHRDWSLNDDGRCFVVRRLTFCATTYGTFREIVIQGHRDGTVTIAFALNKLGEISKTSAEYKYLKQLGIEIDCWLGTYTSKPHENELLFKMLATHNTLPEHRLPLVRQLVASGNWKEVTPLPRGQYLSAYGDKPPSHI